MNKIVLNPLLRIRLVSRQVLFSFHRNRTFKGAHRCKIFRGRLGFLAHAGQWARGPRSYVRYNKKERSEKNNGMNASETDSPELFYF